MTDNERKLTEAAKKIAADLARAQWALEECRKYNRLCNNKDTYLLTVTDYGLLRVKNKPNPSDYGVGEE